MIAPRRALAALALAAGLLAGGAASAEAATSPLPAPDPAVTLPAQPTPSPEPSASSAAPADPANPATPPAAGAAPTTEDSDGFFARQLEKICPSTDPPAPQSPTPRSVLDGTNQQIDVPTTNATTGEDGQGLYARYGDAGLFWTTYDQSCFSGAKADTTLASGVNAATNTFDQMINEAQSYALDPEAGSVFDSMLVRTVAAVSAGLLQPWTIVALMLAGVIVVAGTWTGSISAAVSNALVTVGVLVGVTFVALNPTLIPQASDALTSDVTTAVANSAQRVVDPDLIGPAQPPTGPALTATETMPDTFYRATSYQGWLGGMFCGDERAAKQFGPRFLDDQAFTYAQWAQVQGNPAAEKALVASKNKAWLADAAALQATYPTAFSCWSGESAQRTSAAVKHVAVTAIAGPIVTATSVSAAVMRIVARVSVILVIAFGAAALIVRRISAGLTGLLLLGIFGPPVVAAMAGIVLFGFQAILADPTLAWFPAILAVLFLGIAVLVLARPVMRMFGGGLDGIGSSRRARRQAGRMVRGGADVVHRTSLTAAAGAGAVGGAVGATVTRRRDEAATTGPRGDTARRDDPPAASSPSPRGDTERAPDLAASSLDRYRGRAAANGYTPEPFESELDPAEASARRGVPVASAAPAPSPTPPTPETAPEDPAARSLDRYRAAAAGRPSVASSMDASRTEEPAWYSEESVYDPDLEEAR